MQSILLGLVGYKSIIDQHPCLWQWKDTAGTSVGLGIYTDASCKTMNELFMNEIKFQINILETTKYLSKFMFVMNVT